MQLVLQQCLPNASIADRLRPRTKKELVRDYSVGRCRPHLVQPLQSIVSLDDLVGQALRGRRIRIPKFADLEAQEVVFAWQAFDELLRPRQLVLDMHGTQNVTARILVNGPESPADAGGRTTKIVGWRGNLAFRRGHGSAGPSELRRSAPYVT